MKHILLIHERTSYVSLIRYSVTWPLTNNKALLTQNEGNASTFRVNNITKQYQNI